MRGPALLSEVADRVGLTAAFGGPPTGCGFAGPGMIRVGCWWDVAAEIADGAETITDVQALRNQPQVHGQVASTATIWRVLDGVDAAVLADLRMARARSGPGPRAGSDRDRVAGVVGVPAGSCARATPGPCTAADHITVLDQALAQLPAAHRSKRILVRVDGAGYSHALSEYLQAAGLECSVGFPTNAAVRASIEAIPESEWRLAVDADGTVRDGADLAEITDLLDLVGWPGGDAGEWRPCRSSCAHGVSARPEAGLARRANAARPNPWTRGRTHRGRSRSRS